MFDSSLNVPRWRKTVMPFNYINQRRLEASRLRTKCIYQFPDDDHHLGNNSIIVISNDFD